MAEALDHPFSLVTACTWLGYLYRVTGDWGLAQPVLERALALSREWKVTLWSPFLLGSLGAVHARSGEVGRGLALIQEALARYGTTGLGLGHSLVLVHLGEACTRAGRMDEALAAGEQALALCRERGEQGHEAWALRLLGEVAAGQHALEVARAEAHYRAAMDLADRLGMRPLLAHCHLGLGRLYTPTCAERAERHLEAAGRLYGEMDLAEWWEETEARSDGGSTTS
jgi:tetratricopeptide (TPR) repeat protein